MSAVMGAHYTAEQIRALVEAGIALTSELSLEVILQKLVEIARSQVNSRYAALSVLDDDGHSHTPTMRRCMDRLWPALRAIY